MSRIIKNLVDGALYKDGQKINILLLGDNETSKIIINSCCQKHVLYSFEELPGCFKISQEDIFNNLTYNFNLVICTEPYKKIKYISAFAHKTKLPVLLVHGKAPEGKKEEIFRAAFELDKFYNVAESHKIYDEIGIISADVQNLKTLDWNNYLNVLLLKNR